MGQSDGHGQAGSVREWLRGLEVFAGPPADFDPARAPAEPVDLFLAWPREAAEAGMPDAHAVSWPLQGHQVRFRAGSQLIAFITGAARVCDDGPTLRRQPTTHEVLT